jgi:hypothetical protein
MVWLTTLIDHPFLRGLYNQRQKFSAPFGDSD